MDIAIQKTGVSLPYNEGLYQNFHQLASEDARNLYEETQKTFDKAQSGSMEDELNAFVLLDRLDVEVQKLSKQQKLDFKQITGLSNLRSQIAELMNDVVERSVTSQKQVHSAYESQIQEDLLNGLEEYGAFEREVERDYPEMDR